MQGIPRNGDRCLAALAHGEGFRTSIICGEMESSANSCPEISSVGTRWWILQQKGALLVRTHLVASKILTLKLLKEKPCQLIRHFLEEINSKPQEYGHGVILGALRSTANNSHILESIF